LGLPPNLKVLQRENNPINYYFEPTLANLRN